MKVCFVLPRLLPSPDGVLVGGAIKSATLIAGAMHRMGVHVKLVSGMTVSAARGLEQSELGQIISPCLMPEKALRLSRSPELIVRLIREVGRLHRMESFDIIHSHSGFYPYALVPYVAGRRHAVTLHSLYCPVRRRPHRPGRFLGGSAAGAMLRRLDHVVAISENVALSIMAAGVPGKKVSVVYPAINGRALMQGRGGRWSPIIQAQLEDRLRILFVGNCSREKGLDLLLEAVRSLVDSGQRVGLVLTIENATRSRDYSLRESKIQDQIQRLRLGGVVLRLGVVKNIEQLYAACDVFAVPFRSTAGPSDYPLPLLEAMGSGLVVVATNVGGVPEVVRDGVTGFLVGGACAKAMAEGIARAVSRAQEWTRIRTAARQYVAERFFAETIAAHLCRLYDTLLTEQT